MPTNELTDRFRELHTSLESLPEVMEPPKPVLRILGVARAEQKWNTLLAYFLDPSQPHGFGSSLLEQFLQQVERVTAEEIEYYYHKIEDAIVETEVRSQENNQPDVLIRVPGEWFMIIESKVDASEGPRQTHRYVEDTNVGNESKDQYPEDGHHYVFLSKGQAPDSSADTFADVYWQDIVRAFQTELNLSYGQYPEQSVNQLRDFLSTIITVTNMEPDNFERIQKKKVQLLSEYRGDIDELFAAAESLRERAIEEWPELFVSHIDEEVWTDEWNIDDGQKKYGTIFKDGWWLDNESLEPTISRDKTIGDRGFRLYFNHMIRNRESFVRGQLTFRLRSITSVPLRSEFNRLYNSDRWQEELNPLLDARDITNKGNKRNYMVKTYDVDQSGLPESYFETLTAAFEEHLPVVEVVDEILNEAVSNINSN